MKSSKFIHSEAFNLSPRLNALRGLVDSYVFDGHTKHPTDDTPAHHPELIQVMVSMRYSLVRHHQQPDQWKETEMNFSKTWLELAKIHEEFTTFTANFWPKTKTFNVVTGLDLFRVVWCFVRLSSFRGRKEDSKLLLVIWIVEIEWAKMELRINKNRINHRIRSSRFPGVSFRSATSRWPCPRDCVRIWIWIKCTRTIRILLQN